MKHKLLLLATTLTSVQGLAIGSGDGGVDSITWLSPGGGLEVNSGGTVLARWSSAVPIISPSFSLCATDEACGAAVWPVVTRNKDHSYSAILPLPVIPAVPPVASFFLRMRADDQRVYDTAFFDVLSSPIDTDNDETVAAAAITANNSKAVTPRSTTTASSPTSQSTISPSSTAASLDPFATAELWPSGFSLPNRPISPTPSASGSVSPPHPSSPSPSAQSLVESQKDAAEPQNHTAQHIGITVGMIFAGCSILGVFFFLLRRHSRRRTQRRRGDPVGLGGGFGTWGVYRGELTGLPPRLSLRGGKGKEGREREFQELKEEEGEKEVMEYLNTLNSRTEETPVEHQPVTRVLPPTEPLRLFKSPRTPEVPTMGGEVRGMPSPWDVESPNRTAGYRETLTDRPASPVNPFSDSPSSPVNPFTDPHPPTHLSSTPTPAPRMAPTPSQIHYINNTSISRAVSLCSEYSVETRLGERSVRRPESEVGLVDGHRGMGELYASLYGGKGRE